MHTDMRMFEHVVWRHAAQMVCHAAWRVNTPETTQTPAKPSTVDTEQARQNVDTQHLGALSIRRLGRARRYPGLLLR